MRKRIIPILIVVVVLAGVGYYWWSNYSSSAAANSELGGSGTIEAQQIAITPQTSGRIIVAPPVEGVAVKTGDVLYKLDPTTLKLQIKSAQAGVTAAESNYRHVRDDSSSTRAEKDAAKAQWQQAQIAEQMAVVQLGYTTIKSPADGILSSIAQNVGENAVPGTTLAMLSEIDSLTVTIYVPETQIGQVKMGQAGTLTTDSTTKVYNARVNYISSQAEFTPSSIETKDQRVKLVYQVQLNITDADSNLKPGMPADVVLK
ncbi:MAG: HlyD family efflux transporter periplasmic adaptor subunit [Coriobacteriia bacterium]|nr:HlyD family efflux transporter periplasmic adaptor subunit [Coriobacteriia bacterium]